MRHIRKHIRNNRTGAIGMVMLLLLLSTVPVSCDVVDDMLGREERDNPWDPEREKGDSPVISTLEINGQPVDPESGTISVTFQDRNLIVDYTGNLDPDIMMFEARLIYNYPDPDYFHLDIIVNEMSWDNRFRFNAHLFEDGRYTLELTPRIAGPDGEIGNTVSLEFDVYLRQTRTLSVFPARVHARPGERFFVDFWLTEIPDIYAAELQVQFNQSMLQLRAVNTDDWGVAETEPFIAPENGIADWSGVEQITTPVFSSREDHDLALRQSNEQGLIDLNTVLAGRKSDPEAAVGETGALLRFFFEALEPSGIEPGQTEIRILDDHTRLLDMDGNLIDVNAYETGRIEIGH